MFRIGDPVQAEKFPGSWYDAKIVDVARSTHDTTQRYTVTFPGKGARWDATLDADQIRNTACESGTKLASRGATDFGPSGKEPAVSSARSS